MAGRLPGSVSSGRVLLQDGAKQTCRMINGLQQRNSSDRVNFGVPLLQSYSGFRSTGLACGYGESSNSLLLRNSCVFHALPAPRSRTALKTEAVFEKYTERAIKVSMLAQQHAKALGFHQVSSEHILLGLIHEAITSSNILKGVGAGITTERAISVCKDLFSNKTNPQGSNKDVPFDLGAKRVLEGAVTESKRMGMNFVGPEHIFISLLSVGENGSKTVLRKLGCDWEMVKAEAVKKLRNDMQQDGEKLKRQKVATGSSVGASKPKEGDALKDFCLDLCAEARANRIDPVIGREKEVTRVMQILARRSKNNPILLGEPGVGKTAIAEGLAMAILSGANSDGTPVPEFLRSKRLLQLDVALLISGAKERGEVESRVTRLLSEIKDAGDVILVIDECHTLIGAGAVGQRSGSSSSGLDVSNLFKPALGRGHLQVIGATTLDEHRKYIQKDAALERRFQPVHVDEPTEPEAVEILQGLKERYERHHRCVYAPDAMAAAVALSARYVADRFLPDKAIDLMDEAGSRARIDAYSARRLTTVDGNGRQVELAAWHELCEVVQAKDEAVLGGYYEEADLLKQRVAELLVGLSGPANEAPYVPLVSVADIASVLEAWTSIPAARMTQDDRIALLGLGSAIKERVIGQEEAVDSVARAMKRSRTGLKDPDRPIAAMLFSGPTGVGKTELTKVLAERYFGSESSMIRLDMSEFMERHSVSKLIGSPPGYVGFGAGGLLTEAVRRKPHSVVLLDEVEKAHPDVFHMLLQVLEDGRLTDSQGRVVSFKNTLIIMTSNVGSNVIAKGASQLGFSLPTNEADGGHYTQIRSLVMEELKAYFRPELLNRLDEVVVFRPLGLPEAASIAGLALSDTRERMEKRGFGLSVSPAVLQRVIDEGFSEEYGARSLRRAVTRIVEDPLSDAILGGSVGEGDVVIIDCLTGEPVTVTTEREIAENESKLVSGIVAASSLTRLSMDAMA